MSQLTTMASLAVLLFFAPVSRAAVVMWQLQGVTFYDGGTATGFFTLDDTAFGLVGDFDIQTSATASFPAATYSRRNGSTAELGQLGVEINGPARVLLLRFFGRILNEDGSILSAPQGLSFELRAGDDSAQSREDLYDTSRTPRSRIVRVGSVVAVPEPSPFVLLGMGVAAIVVLPIGHALKRLGAARTRQRCALQPLSKPFHSRGDVTI